MDRYQITLHPSKEPYERFPEKIIKEMLSTPEGRQKLSGSMRQLPRVSILDYEREDQDRRRSILAALGIPSNFSRERWMYEPIQNTSASS